MEEKDLLTENKMYKDLIESINAEKIALDQLLVETLKNSLQAKKEAVINEGKVKKLISDLELLKKEKEEGNK